MKKKEEKQYGTEHATWPGSIKEDQRSASILNGSNKMTIMPTIVILDPAALRKTKDPPLYFKW